MLYLYTDGSSTGRKEREWGWGFVLKSEDKIIAQCYGGGPSGTNNIAELTAAMEGFAYIIENKLKGPVKLISDSMYVLGIATGEYTAHKNVQLARLLRLMFKYLKAEAEWVKGHSGDEFNEVADQLSKKGKAEYAKKL